MKINTQTFFNFLAGLIICLLAGRAMCQTTTLLYSFAGNPDAANPWGALVLDSQGNLYGATVDGGACTQSIGCGSAFELTPLSGGGWSEKVLYSLPGGGDAYYPYSGLAIGPSGTLFGETYFGDVFQLRQVSGVWQARKILGIPDGIDAGLLFDSQIGVLVGASVYQIYEISQKNGV